MSRSLPVLAFVAALAAASCVAPAREGRPPPAESVLLHALDQTEGLEGGGRIGLSRDRVEGVRAVKWQVGPGTKHGLTFSFADRGIEAAEWGEVRFRYKVLTEGWTWLGIKLCDHPVADGMQATWRIDGGKGIGPGGWREAVIDLEQPMYRWGDKPDKESQWLCFRAMADAPAAILLDDVRSTRAALRTRIVEETTSRDEARRLRYTWQIEARNPTDTPKTVRVTLDSTGLRAFRPSLSAERLTLAPKQTARVEVALTAAADAPAKFGALVTERTTVRFIADASPKPIVYPVEIAAVTGLPPHNHPVLLVTKNDVAAITQKVAKHEWAKKAYDPLIKGADAWLKRKIKLPDRGGQWWHWYSCPKCGMRLKTVSPTKHHCATCKKDYSGEPYDSVVLSRDHSRLARAVEDLGLAYQLSGNKLYAAKAAEILERYAEKYLNYPRHDTRGRDRVGGGRIGPQTLDESTWLIPVVQGYDLIWETLSRPQRATIEEKLLRPAAELIKEHKIGIHNIQCWKNSAVGLVGICLDEPRFLADAVTSEHGIHKQLAKGILDDGVWFEGAWGYHYYTMMALAPLAEALRHVGIDVYTDRYKGFYAAPLRFALPNGLLPAVNDSGEANAYGPWYRYEVAYARWRDPAFAAMLKGRSRVSRESLLYGEPELVKGAKLPTGSRNFPVAGYAYLQCGEGDDGPVAILDYGPHGGGHGHPEKLQLLLYAQGEIVAPDPGCIHYGVPLHREWYRQTIAHNTVTVDRQSQKPCQGKLRFFHATPELAVASATADDAYGGVRFARTVAVLRGGIVVDVVELASDEPHAYDWAFHCYGKPSIRIPAGDDVIGLGTANGYQHIRNSRGGIADGPITARWAGDKTAVGLHMLRAADTLLYAGDGYGQPSSRELPTLVVRRRGRTAFFASAFCIGAKDAQPPSLTTGPAPEGSVRLLLKTATEETAVLLRTVQAAPHAESDEILPPLLAFDTDAPAAVVRRRGEALAAIAMGGGTRLTAGEARITSSRKTSLSLTCNPDGSAAVAVDTAKETTLRLTGLFADAAVVTRDDGSRVRSTWRRGIRTFTASSGRYHIGPADE